MKYLIVLLGLTLGVAAQTLNTTCQTLMGTTYCNTVVTQPIDLGYLRPVSPQIDYTGWYLAMALRASQPPRPKMTKADKAYLKCLNHGGWYDDNGKCVHTMAKP